MRKKGVTLVELVAVIAIMSIVYGIIYTILVSGNRVYRSGSNEIDIQSSARSAFITVGEDLKKARYSKVHALVADGTSTIRITNSKGSKVSFSNVTGINATDLKCIYIEIDDANYFIYVVRNINGRNELHKMNGSGVDNTVTAGFQTISFIEQDNVFTISFSKLDKNNNLREYSTSVSIRNRK